MFILSILPHLFAFFLIWPFLSSINLFFPFFVFTTFFFTMCHIFVAHFTAFYSSPYILCIYLHFCNNVITFFREFSDFDPMEVEGIKPGIH